MSLLTVSNLTKRFGGLVCVNEVDFSFEEGVLSAIIGPNGAGKTTFFNMITGIYAPDEGRIVLAGTSIAGLKPDKIARMGISRTFQNIRSFGTMTVIENVMVGMHAHLRAGIFGSILQLPRIRQEEKAAILEAYRLLEYLGLKEWANERADSLPYGAQRRLEIARALATRPKVLLLDEPAAGMNPKETAELTSLIKHIRQEFELTIVLIEHDMRLVMELSDHILVLDYGTKIAEGSPDHIRSNPRVIEAYLGKSAAKPEVTV